MHSARPTTADSAIRTPRTTQLPAFIPPQLSRFVSSAPEGGDWLHEIKYDGYRIHTRLDAGDVRMLTRTGLNWTAKYAAVAAVLSRLPVRSAYLDGELCGVRADGTTSFSMIQAASDTGNAPSLVYFAFDVLHLDGQDLTPLPLRERKGRLAELLAGVGRPLQYSDHLVGRGPEFLQQACKLCLEGIVSKRADAAYVPGNRGLWVKTKCLNREEFVVVGWTDPEGSRPHLGALLLAYYAPDGRLVYAGRAGTGMTARELNNASPMERGNRVGCEFDPSKDIVERSLTKLPEHPGLGRARPQGPSGTEIPIPARPEQ